MTQSKTSVHNKRTASSAHAAGFFSDIESGSFVFVREIQCRLLGESTSVVVLTLQLRKVGDPVPIRMRYWTVITRG